jgi:nondiscriminating glutamyl-tRNA synthetase
MTRIRVRFAPSPTGYLHIGGARTALYNWLYARKTGGAFILRIEDTDVERSTRSSYEMILDAMRWLGLDWDEGPDKGGDFGPYFQSARLVIYHTQAQKLLDQDMAYRCFCTQKELQEIRKAAADSGETKYDGRCRNLPREEIERRLQKETPHVVRFRIPAGETRFNDLVHGTLSFDNSDLDDFVIIKSDGKPTYNFAAAADDAGMRITHVIRGDDHISNTPKQVLIYKALGCSIPKFVHLPMILGSDRSRLSKRHGATSVQEYRRMGYLSDALVNYLALLGWAYDDKTEFFTRSDLINKFSLKRVSKNPAAFDMEKLKYINGEHFKRMNSMEKANLVFEILEDQKVLPPDFETDDWQRTAGAKEKRTEESLHKDVLVRLAFILNLMGNRLKVAGDAPDLLRYFYKDDYEKDRAAYEKYMQGPEVAALLGKLAVVIEKIELFDRTAIEKGVRGLAAELGVKAADLIHPCRVALTGRAVSPDIFSVIHLLGRKKCVERLKAAADHILSASRA